MAKVQVTNVTVLDNPSSFLNPFQFQITFESIEDLQDDLEWKIIYVGSAESKDHDQVLDSVLVGPIKAGQLMFVFQADAPDPSLVPQGDILGVTVVLLTCSYQNREFVRVGYYLNNEYLDPEMRENPPATVNVEEIQRNILTSNPRITRFKIPWDDEHPAKAGEGDAATATAASVDAGNGTYSGMTDMPAMAGNEQQMDDS